VVFCVQSRHESTPFSRDHPRQEEEQDDGPQEGSLRLSSITQFTCELMRRSPKQIIAPENIAFLWSTVHAAARHSCGAIKT
jgi:hypothetical protein